MDIIHLKYGLFRKRRFLPIFLAQFLGAVNDNLLRSGLIVLITYAERYNAKLPLGAGEHAAILVTICSALLVVPFILFSSIAGPLADKFEKGRLVTLTKIAEIGIMLVAYYGFVTHNIYLLMGMLFVSGTHSTFFGPIKYSILPEQLKDAELLAGNGFISGATYLGILLGLISGALLMDIGTHAVGIALVAIAVVGLVASLCIPRTHAAAPDTHINLHLWHGTLHILEFPLRSKPLLNAIMGLSWFLLVGSVFMAQFANYANQVMHADNHVYTLFLVVFSVGIAAGSVICDWLLKGEISPRYAPWMLLGVSIFTYGMVFTTPQPTGGGELLSVTEFLSSWRHYPVLICMLMVAICGGIYIVPLYAMLQSKSEAHFRSRVIAASNLFDSLFMTIVAIVCVVLLSAGMGITDLFVVVATVNLLVCLYARKAAADYPDHPA